MSRTVIFVVSVRGVNKGFGVIQSLCDKAPIFLAVEISFRVAREETKKYAVILHWWCRPIRSENKKNGIF